MSNAAHEIDHLLEAIHVDLRVVVGLHAHEISDLVRKGDHGRVGRSVAARRDGAGKGVDPHVVRSLTTPVERESGGVPRHAHHGHSPGLEINAHQHQRVGEGVAPAGHEVHADEQDRQAVLVGARARAGAWAWAWAGAGAWAALGLGLGLGLGEGVASGVTDGIAEPLPVESGRRLDRGSRAGARREPPRPSRRSMWYARLPCTTAGR